MGYALNQQQFNQFLEEVGQTYAVFGPILQRGKGKFAETDVVGYGRVKGFEDFVWGQKSYFSPKEVLYPVRETLFYFNDGVAQEPPMSEKPALIFLRPCDLNGLGRLDQIFLKNGQFEDFYYKRRRESAKFIVLECVEGFDTCFCVSMASNRVEESQYNGALRWSDEGVILQILDDALLTQSLIGLKDRVEEPFDLQFISENKVCVEIPPLGAIESQHFQHDLWREYTDRCIACGRCNTSCITCSCFSMQDIALSAKGDVAERRRVWASCHVDGYTEMAGGHQFRSKNGERMRFRTLHKINDFHRRFGFHMCVGCGRCDDVCPEYISFSKCINKLKQIVDLEANHD